MKNGLLSIVLGLAGKAFKAIGSLFRGAGTLAKPLFRRAVTFLFSTFSPSAKRAKSEAQGLLDSLRKRAEEELAKQANQTETVADEVSVEPETEECPDIGEPEMIQAEIVESMVVEPEQAAAIVEEAPATEIAPPSCEVKACAPVKGSARASVNKANVSANNGLAVALPKLGRALMRAFSQPQPVRNIPDVIAASASAST